MIEGLLIAIIAVCVVGLAVIRFTHRNPAFVTFKGEKDNGTPEKRKKAIQARQAARNALVKHMQGPLSTRFGPRMKAVKVPRGTMTFTAPDGKKHKRSI